MRLVHKLYHDKQSKVPEDPLRHFSIKSTEIIPITWCTRCSERAKRLNSRKSICIILPRTILIQIHFKTIINSRNLHYLFFLIFHENTETSVFIASFCLFMHKKMRQVLMNKLLCCKTAKTPQACDLENCPKRCRSPTERGQVLSSAFCA